MDIIGDFIKLQMGSGCTLNLHTANKVHISADILLNALLLNSQFLFFLPITSVKYFKDLEERLMLHNFTTCFVMSPTTLILYHSLG
jgi:hypothetical protein